MVVVVLVVVVVVVAAVVAHQVDKVTFSCRFFVCSFDFDKSEHVSVLTCVCMVRATYALRWGE